MLSIKLKQGEHIMIGDSIKVYYDRTNSKGYISVAVDAPREIPVMRGAMYEEKQAKMFPQEGGRPKAVFAKQKN